MAPKDHRQDDGGGAGGGGGGTATAGKRTITQGIVQKKDPPAIDLTYRPAEPTYVSSAVDKFRAAVDRGDVEGAKQLWHGLEDGDRTKWSQGATIEKDLDQCRRVLGTYLLQIMEDTGLRFGPRPALLKAILKDKSAKNDWLAGLARRATLWNDFLDSLPDRETMTEEDAQKLGKTMLSEDGMGNIGNTLDVVKKLFAYIYAPLIDETYDADRVRVRPWKLEWIHRLYKIISTLPFSHVRTAKGIAIGYEEKDDGETVWKPLRNAWWSRSRYIVLNESSAKDGGKKTHSMTGGKNRGEVINKFDVGALHEVGHGVGQMMGANDWTLGHPWVGWQVDMSVDDWSKGLWGSDGDMKQRLWEKLGEKADVLDASEARKYMAAQIAGKEHRVTTRGFGKAEKVEAFIRKHWRDQKLTRYWERVMNGDKKDMYSFKGDANIGDDDRVYVYLTRGDSYLCSYNAVAHRKRVSSYSVSSPREWWAEQYAHYYRQTPHGTGLDDGTKQKLDELHTQKFEDDDAIMRPGGGPGAKGEDSSDDRQPFPW